ncbi:hypothetical protein V0288_19695 [Pannus brasiliensis CCIBt3594]|uniref:Uncharacterized protein n=1 Tax=Pannus brasiliensis CCIBt3594 TaxID=1427578 RepID=A0AAW9QVI1_9CHRO
MSTNEMDIDAKIGELAKKYNIPEKLFKDVMALETEKSHLKNRRLAPKIVEMIAKYTDSSR